MDLKISKIKKNTRIIASIFCFVNSLLIFVTSMLLLMNKALIKFSNNDILETFFTKEFLAKYEEYNILFIGLLFLSFFAMVFAGKNLKKFTAKNDKADFRTGLTFLNFVLSVLFVLIAILCYKEMMANDLLGFVGVACLLILIYGGLAILFSLISFFVHERKKKAVHKKEELALEEKKTLESVDGSTAFVAEKIKKLKQLKDLNLITEKQYDDAVARFTNSI